MDVECSLIPNDLTIRWKDSILVNHNHYDKNSILFYHAPLPFGIAALQIKFSSYEASCPSLAVTSDASATDAKP